jgi:pimeloyl-ACP methyl ester carboxylesterase
VTTFALVHGAWLGAWCWELLTPLLDEAGHHVVAIDLPCEDGSACFDVYADVVCASLAGCGNDVVLVGHSLGGHIVPLVAARRSVRHLVYLCGVVPEIGRSLLDQLRSEPNTLNPLWQKAVSEADVQTRTAWLDLDIAQRVLFHDCDDRTTITAVHRLRPQAVYPHGLTLSFGSIPSRPNDLRCFCSDDNFLRPEWSKRVADDRLGAELIELPGSHSPFLSRPRAVADVLLRVADTV